MYTHWFISSLKLPRDCIYNLRKIYIFDILNILPKFPPLSHLFTIKMVVSNTLDTREQLNDARLGLESIQLRSKNVKLSCICHF